MPPHKPVIAHSLTSWLPLTMTWLYNQLKYTNDFSSVVLTLTRPRNLGHFPWQPVYVGSGGRISRLVLRTLERLGITLCPAVYADAVREHRPSILHSHFANTGWRDLSLAKKFGLKHVVTFYGFDVGMLPNEQPIWRRRYEELFEKADLFLCEGPHEAKCIIRLGCPEEKLEVQRLGIETGKIPFRPRKIGEDGIIKILIAGAFREKKGIPYALEAIGILKGKYPRIKVTIIGDSGGQEREELEKKKIKKVINDYNLASDVRLLGLQPFSLLLDEAYKHHIFLSPSVTASDGDTEGGTIITVTEMAASGMPVVSTWHCDIPETVQDGITGFLVKERNAEEISRALDKLIQDPELIESFGRRAREYVEKKFNIENTIKELESKYRRLMGK